MSLDKLTPREREVAGLIAQGKANKEIAHNLGITEGTVEQTITHMFRKLGASNRVEVAVLIAKEGR